MKDLIFNMMQKEKRDQRVEVPDVVQIVQESIPGVVVKKAERLMKCCDHYKITLDGDYMRRHGTEITLRNVGGYRRNFDERNYEAFLESIVTSP